MIAWCVIVDDRSFVSVRSIRLSATIWPINCDGSQNDEKNEFVIFLLPTPAACWSRQLESCEPIRRDHITQRHDRYKQTRTNSQIVSPWSATDRCRAFSNRQRVWEGQLAVNSTMCSTAWRSVWWVCWRQTQRPQVSPVIAGAGTRIMSNH